MALVQTTAFLGNLVKGIDAKFLEVFDENVDAYKSSLDTLFRQRKSVQKREHTRLKAGTGLLVKKDEGGPYTYDNQKPSFETNYYHNTYGKGVMVTLEEIEDKDYQDKLDEFTDLARSARQTMDMSMAQVLNGGFTTNRVVNGIEISRLNDNVPLFSTVHPLYGQSSTQSNASATSIPLSDTNLETARIALTQQTTDDNQPLTLSSRLVLVVPPALRKLATQLAKSEQTPQDANNAVNVYKGEIDVMEVTWISAMFGGSDTAWFLMAPEQAKLMFITRVAPSMGIDVDSETDDRKYKVRARWSVGYSDWRRTWASKGDGSAYAS